ncbi:hypothetical protein [Nevskia sp.]|uniref:hypothetical protein n=1 Tax=Nevskia sp. TaxID=1929292 RepID=UPI0025FD6D68|nr:hypothetical protein [Nevskia sp.]
MIAVSWQRHLMALVATLGDMVGDALIVAGLRTASGVVPDRGRPPRDAAVRSGLAEFLDTVVPPRA